MVQVKKILIEGDENPYNCLTHYRWEKELSYSELAALLGCSGPLEAYAACSREKAYSQYVEQLAEAEGMPSEAFRLIFREGDML